MYKLAELVGSPKDSVTDARIERWIRSHVRAAGAARDQPDVAVVLPRTGERADGVRGISAFLVPMDCRARRRIAGARCAPAMPNCQYQRFCCQKATAFSIVPYLRLM
jgi:hypothetical protein